MSPPDPSFHNSRARLARRLRRWLEKPMLVLSFAWVALVVVQMVNPSLPYVSQLEDVIWGIFIVDFVTRLLIAAQKLWTDVTSANAT